MADVEFSDDDFKPANIEGHYVVDDKAMDRVKQDLAEVDGHNDQLPIAKPTLGAPPTQAREDGDWKVDGQPSVQKPMLDVKPNYPSGYGGFAMRPNVGEPERIYRKPFPAEISYEDVKPGQIIPQPVEIPAEFEGIEGPEDLDNGE